MSRARARREKCLHLKRARILVIGWSANSLRECCCLPRRLVHSAAVTFALAQQSFICVDTTQTSCTQFGCLSQPWPVVQTNQDRLYTSVTRFFRTSRTHKSSRLYAGYNNNTRLSADFILCTPQHSTALSIAEQRLLAGHAAIVSA